MPTELQGYETLLSALGVPKEFSPNNFVQVLCGMEAQSRGRPLDSDTLATAVGVCCMCDGRFVPFRVIALVLLVAVVAVLLRLLLRKAGGKLKAIHFETNQEASV